MTAPTPETKPNAASPPRKPLRLDHKRSHLPTIITLGQRRTPLEDFYHWIMTRTWPQFFAFVARAVRRQDGDHAARRRAAPDAPPGQLARKSDDRRRAQDLPAPVREDARGRHDARPGRSEPRARQDAPFHPDLEPDAQDRRGE